MAGFASEAAAQGAVEASEARVKAAYLYRFLAYVHWPAGALGSDDAPLVIGVLGADAVLRELAAAVAGRRSQGRPVLARRVLPGDSLAGLHVLHLGRNANPPPALHPPRLPPWRDAALPPLLVVTDQPSGVPAFASLNFITVERRVRFEASPRGAARAGLKLSARLLQVAERVQPP